jgi:hypothetical protein
MAALGVPVVPLCEPKQGQDEEEFEKGKFIFFIKEPNLRCK